MPIIPCHTQHHPEAALRDDVDSRILHPNDPENRVGQALDHPQGKRRLCRTRNTVEDLGDE